jgi:hypothetical protein
MKSFFASRFTRAAGMAGTLMLAAWGLGGPNLASAAGTTCGQGGALCSFSLLVDGEEVGTGRYTIGAGGILSIASPVNFVLDDGTRIGVGSISGNADPVLGFNASAGTATNGHSFAFSFDLPISLSGPINANSSISYSLTSTTSAGAEIKPLLPGGKVLTAQEVDTSVGGLDSLPKGVDAGDRFFFTTGPTTLNSPVFTASNSFIGNTQFDTMNALVSFTLSPNSNVGLSGFVQQEAVPEPSTTALMLAGLGLVGWIARRRLNS